MARSRIRRVPASGIHRPHGTSWALTRGALHAVAPDPAAPGPLRGLEREAGFHLNARHAVAFGAAVPALELLLAALELTETKTVLFPALAPSWVPDAVRAAGLRPVPVDVHPHTLHLDPAALRAAAGSDSVAVLVSHTAGVPCDLDTLSATCQELDLPLIELFGQAVGARWRARPVGAWGRAGVACLDCGQLSAFGGALLASDDRALVSRLRATLAGQPEPTGWPTARSVALGHVRTVLAHPTAFGLLHRAIPHGALTPEPGQGPPRLHPAQAEALRTALAQHEAQLDVCRERAAQLRWALPAGAWRQDVPEGALPAWSKLLVRSRDPQRCAAAAAGAGVELATAPLVDHSHGACPHAARAAAECIALPCHRRLGETDMERLVAAVEGWLI